MIAADITALPAGDSPGLVLVPATPAERIASIKLNSIAWKGPLDVETYIARENHLFQQRLTRDGLTCWILVDRTEPEGERTIYSSCESYRKKALLAYDGKVEDVGTHGVGSVYCRPEFRGKGYAKRMLEELSCKLDTWQMEKESRGRSLFSVLFSDIGRSFYAQFGWRPFLSSHMSLLPNFKDGEPDGVACDSEARDLFAEDVQSRLCNDQVLTKLRERMRVASQQSPGAKIAILPDFDHYVWHWAREEFYAQKLFSQRDPPVIKGAGNDKARVYCAWTRNFGETPEDNVLYILRWVYDDPTSPEQEQTTIHAMAAILRRAQLQARDWNMSKVEFWNPSPLLQKAVALLDPVAQVVHREKSSISSLRWTGAEQGLGKDVEWLLNEKYTWC
ncbi:Acyl-CoA N-acyltransferase [Penicillium alfredii]|uniref:Acyl-CoA N-acyltransferase n=1 Tax=Penicillium alfredii TaxID=1506179 RepID=A0A9W9FLD5_9EURO|nr:Acyl-CoA N-acyltransferase [Penicillium alfredii]KAJ5102065.1 Acyl-CoA N-acyltransferase [Penicillium alfredii]